MLRYGFQQIHSLPMGMAKKSSLFSVKIESSVDEKANILPPESFHHINNNYYNLI